MEIQEAQLLNTRLIGIFRLVDADDDEREGLVGQVVAGGGAGEPLEWRTIPYPAYGMARTTGQMTVLGTPVDILFQPLQGVGGITLTSSTQFTLPASRTYLVQVRINVTAGGSTLDTLTIVDTSNNPVGLVNVPFTQEGSPKTMYAVALINTVGALDIKARFTSSLSGLAATISTQGSMIIQALF